MSGDQPERLRGARSPGGSRGRPHYTPPRAESLPRTIAHGGRSYRAAAGRASRRAAERGDRGGPGARGPARGGRRVDPSARGRGRWRGLAALGGVHSALRAAVEEVTSPISWPRALLELGEGRRGPGEGTAGVTERARRRSEREAGVGGERAPAASRPRCSRALPCAPAARCRLPAGPCSWGPVWALCPRGPARRAGPYQPASRAHGCRQVRAEGPGGTWVGWLGSCG